MLLAFHPGLGLVHHQFPEAAGRLQEVGSFDERNRLGGAVMHAYAAADAALEVQLGGVSHEGDCVHLASFHARAAAGACVRVDDGLVVARDSSYGRVESADSQGCPGAGSWVPRRVRGEGQLDCCYS